ncbi:MAG: glutamine amidotransferase, partial [Candidatus Latescibacteria bacterium]|nr:glutamine amidotransferase [Candidatus Latescibacterota bacterium]
FRILHFSGRPNWESKFVRRSLQGAPQLALSSLIRISGAERKFVFRGRDATMANPLFEGFDDQALNAPRYDEAVFIRIGVAESELAVGYPLEASELFRYHLVIWGDIERDFFSLGHLELTREFVAKRGGSFLMLGGPKAFAEGGWTHSAIEPMLPVVLGSAGNHDDVAFKTKPTIEGLLSGVWSLDEDAATNAEKWANLSALYGVNAFASVRAGATVMAKVEAESEAADGQPLFAWQRYGEGLSAVLATGETWPWQMMEDIADATHERFWRQLTRLLATRVPEPVTMVDGGEDAVVEEVRLLKFMVRDSLFEPREGLAVEVQVTGADGGIVNLPVSESIAEMGAYTATLQAKEAGLYHVALTARDAEKTEVGRLDAAVLAQADDREFLSPRYNPDFLKRLASHTGGQFLTLNELDQLAEKIPWTDSAHARLDRFPLWHRPPFYVVIVLLLCAEWYLRRTQGEP